MTHGHSVSRKMSVWLELAEVLTEGISPAHQIVKVLLVLSGAVGRTQDDLRLLVEQPITAGQGFLYRSRLETDKRNELITKAQDEFTKLIRFNEKPSLSSRASYFVGVCHDMLDNPNYARKYYSDAFKHYATAVEACEMTRRDASYSFDEIRDEFGLPYCSITFRVTWKRSSTVRILNFNDYLSSLERLVDLCMPIPCEVRNYTIHRHRSLRSMRHQYFTYDGFRDSRYHRAKELFQKELEKYENGEEVTCPFPLAFDAYNPDW